MVQWEVPSAKNGDVFCNDQLNATATADVTGSVTKVRDSGSDPASTDSGAGRLSKGGLGLLGGRGAFIYNHHTIADNTTKEAHYK